MSNTKKPNRVKIRWGSGGIGNTEEYEFGTLAELNAFLKGVDASSGWLDYEQCDPDDDGYAVFGERGEEDADKA